jgi:hypothetical protein
MIANNDFSVAVHEAGHSVTASHFKIPSYPELTPHGFSRLTQSVSPEHAGLCHYDTAPINPFQYAAISWAGMMAECLYGQPPFWAPPFKPCAMMLRDWHGMMTQQIARLSDGDRSGIIGYRDSWRSCKSAFAIVRKNRARIIRLARAMTGAHAEKAVPLPEKFPATLAEFLQRIVGGSDAAEKFRAFVFDQSAKSFAASQFALDAAQQKDATEKWTAARLEKFRAGFTSADEWQNAALAFKAWQKPKQATATINELRPLAQ